MHWIKPAPGELYVVQTPFEVAKNLEKAFPNKNDPISAERYMDVILAECPVPPGLELESEAPEAPGM